MKEAIKNRLSLAAFFFYILSSAIFIAEMIIPIAARDTSGVSEWTLGMLAIWFLYIPYLFYFKISVTAGIIAVILSAVSRNVYTALLAILELLILLNSKITPWGNQHTGTMAFLGKCHALLFAVTIVFLLLFRYETLKKKSLDAGGGQA